MGPIFLTGANGQVGSEIEPMLAEFGEVRAPRREQLDLGRLDLVREYLRDLKPGWIVNPAAYTAVDKAEEDRETAYLLNAELPRVLGEEAARLNAVVIHYSTDYVFAGDGSAAFLETDATGPLGVYGASKLAGENALAATRAAHFIFRTSWVYASTGKNFVRTILKLASERDEVKIVADQTGAPTWARDLGRVTRHVIGRCEATGNATAAARSMGGIYHACNSGETTWYDFANAVIALARVKRPSQPWAHVSPIQTADYPTPAKRPVNSRLNCSKLEKDLGFRMPAWPDSLRSVIDEIFAD